MMINRRREVTRRDRPFLRPAAIFLCRTNHLSVSEAAARHCHRHHGWPVIPAVSAALCADLRCSAEFAHCENEAIVEHTTLSEIADKCRDEMIEERQERFESFRDAAIGRDIVAVIVAVA